MKIMRAQTMHIFLGISAGTLGILWLVGAFSNPGFPNRNSNAKAGVASFGAMMMFVSVLSNQFAAASALDLFGFIGCMLGVIGCIRILCIRFPKMM